jgi:hypothetical protein
VEYLVEIAGAKEVDEINHTTALHFAIDADRYDVGATKLYC